MIITGKIEDTTGAVLCAVIDFLSQSTPLVGASGVVNTNSDTTVRSNPSDGTFSVQLVAGNYQVTISANGRTTTFTIAVPSGSGTMTLDQVVSSPLAYVFTPPNQIWNGVRAGGITFSPIANPAAPTTAAATVGGGHQGSGDAYDYQLAWVDQFGNQTFHSPDVLSTGPTGGHNSTTLTLPTAPTGVAYTNIYRSNQDGTTNRYFLAQVAANVTTYNDWQSKADFTSSMNPALTAPLFNATAGQLLTSNGTILAVVSDQGFYFPNTNARIVPGKGLQIYNADTGLWHTLLCQLNPAQLAVDAGNP